MKLLLALCGGLFLILLYVALITAQRQADAERVEKRVRLLQDPEGRQAPMKVLPPFALLTMAVGFGEVTEK